ncbi:MAG TPA: hypothetical protein VMZ92_01990 [Planctomycetota bacterium]|nr:hypothetical protein [Planctomycetota bacterium]
MRICLLVCVGAVLGVFTLSGLAMCEDADGLERLRTETARLAGVYEALKPGVKYDRQAFANDVLQVDALARTVVTDLFHRHRDFDAVVKASEGVIKWREWPHSATQEAMSRFVGKGLRGGKALQINYRSWRRPGGEVVYVLQNSFWNRKNHYRLSACIWLVALDDKVTTTILPELFAGLLPGHVFAYGGKPPSVLGLTDAGTALQGIVVLSGPSGTGHYSTFHLYVKDGKGTPWIVNQIYECNGPGAFSYDEEKRELRRDDFGSKKTTTCVICDSNGPLQMAVSTVPGANYTLKEAPLVITATNTGDKPIKMRARFTDERIFRTGLFNMDMRRMDGKKVQCWITDAAVHLPEKDEQTYQEIAPNESFQIKIDLAKAVRNLKEGEYLFSIWWSDVWDENSFSGFVRAPAIKLTIKPGG